MARLRADALSDVVGRALMRRGRALRIVRPLVQWVVALALAGLVAFLVFDWAFTSESRGVSDWRPFDRAEWLEHADSDERRNPRWLMVPDLKKRMKAAPMSRAQVVTLLGPPTFERGSTLHYALGWWGGLDPSSFAVEILENGHMGRLRVVGN